MARTIDLETHFATQAWVDAMYANDGWPRFSDDPTTGNRRLWYWAETFEPYGDRLLDRLLDLGDGRIREMDAGSVDMAVVSLSAPGAEHFSPSVGSRVAKQANDALAAAIDKYPDRLAGFASLAPRDPETAVKELERAVKELGLKGWKTHSNLADSYLDDKRYWPILAKAAELDVPVYLHPSAPLIDELRTYGLALAGAAFGFGVETAAAMVRLALSGVFDAFPGLKVVLGHYGEGLPFLMQRIDFAFVRPHMRADPGSVPELRRLPSAYLHANMYVTTSGNYLPAAFKCTREVLGMDKILLGTDYPYEEMTECLAFLESLDLSDADKVQLYHDNATGLGFA